MATIRWKGDAPDIAQVTTVTLGGTVAVGDDIVFTINGKTLRVQAESTSLTALATLIASEWDDCEIAEFLEVTATASENVVTLTAATAGKPFTVTVNANFGQITIVETTPGTDGTDEVQQFYFATTPTGGTYTITYDGQTTTPINYNASAATVLAALIALSNLATGDVAITGAGTSSNPFVLTFGGTLAATNVAQITVNGAGLKGGNTITIETIRNGSAGATNAIFVVATSGDAATFTIKFRPTPDDEYETTGTLNWNDSAATVQTALEALNGIVSGDVLVTGGRRQTSNRFAFYLELKGRYAGREFEDAAVATTTSNVTANSLYGETGGDDATVAYEYEIVNLGAATAGTFTLSDGVQTTAAIAFNATTATVQAAVDLAIASAPYAGFNAGTDGVLVFRRSGVANATALTIGTGSLTGTGTVATVRNGGVSALNEMQRVHTDATGGSLTLTFGGQTTTSLAYDANAATVDAALTALSTIDSVTVTGSGTSADPWFVEFTGSHAGTDVAELTGSAANLTGGISATVSTTTAGSGATNEVQTVTIAASGGTFALSYEGSETAALAYNATANAVRDALCDTAGIAGTDEVQTVTITGTPTGGTFTLTYSGQTTAGIAYNANAATVQAALEALSNIAVGDVVCTGGALPGTAVTVTFRETLGRTNVAAMTGSGASLTGGSSPAVVIATVTAGDNSDVTVSGSAGGPYTVTFVNNLAATNVDLMVGDNTNLTGTATVTATLAEEVASSGKWHANDVLNYTGGALPVNGDTLIFTDSDADCLYGLNALAAVTLAELIVNQSFIGTIGLPDYDQEGEYYQYRGKYLEVSATLVSIGAGDGAGSGRLKLDLKAVASTITVQNTGQPADQGRKAVAIKGTHASNVLNVVRGSVDVAPDQGDASTIVTARVSFAENVTSDSDVRFGDAVTLTTVTVQGGKVEVASATTDLIVYDGEVMLIGTGAQTDIDLYGGKLINCCSGVVTDLLISNAEADYSRDPRPKVVTNTIQGYRGGILRDPLGVLIAGGLDIKDNTGGFQYVGPPNITSTVT